MVTAQGEGVNTLLMEQVLQMVPQTRVLGSEPRRAEPAAAEEVSLPSASVSSTSAAAGITLHPLPACLSLLLAPSLDSLCPLLALSPESWPVRLAGQVVRWEVALAQLFSHFSRFLVSTPQ